MADDLGDDDYYLQEEVATEPIETNEKKPKEKKKSNNNNSKKKGLLKRAVGTYSDLLTAVRVHYKKSKSQYEFDALLSIFTPNLSASSPLKSSISLDEYLNELVPSQQWAKHAELSAAPVVLIVAQSALRCIELGKVLKGSSSSKLFTFHYLFAKHKKLDEQVEHLRKPTTVFNVIIGTPKRLDDVFERNVLNLKRLKFVLVDWNYENIKQQRLTDLNQLKSELFHLLCEQNSLYKRFAKEKAKIGLF